VCGTLKRSYNCDLCTRPSGWSWQTTQLANQLLELTVDAVQSETEEDPNKEPLEHHHVLPWLRWKMGQQPDFKGEVNVLE
jgi:hypothetical protein